MHVHVSVCVCVREKGNILKTERKKETALGIWMNGRQGRVQNAWLVCQWGSFLGLHEHAHVGTSMHGIRACVCVWVCLTMWLSNKLATCPESNL